MQQQVSIITLGVTDLGRWKCFYMNGFGWRPIFDDAGIVFYQMNGFMLGTWSTHALEEDIGRPGLVTPGAFSLAHNVGSREAVDGLLSQLVDGGGRLLRAGNAPPHGGYRGYVSDPDDHAWEIAWNPA